MINDSLFSPSILVQLTSENPKVKQGQFFPLVPTLHAAAQQALEEVNLLSEIPHKMQEGCGENLVHMTKNDNFWRC